MSLSLVDGSDESGSTPLERLIIGDSPSIRRLRSLVERVAPASLPVLIEGPTGSGKELVAQALHSESRRDGELVCCNVCAISDAMFEDALFGHVKGAFTGAVRDTMGYLLEAHRGTIFLDEISGLALGSQPKLLRVIETRSFRQVGGRADRSSEFRVVVATNERLSELVAAGSFRQDLFERLAGVTIRVPPLSERLEDVPILATHFARQMRKVGVRAVFDDEALRALQRHDWPGNVRELKHTVERLLSFAVGTCVAGGDVTQALEERGGRRRSHVRAAFADRRTLETLKQTDGDIDRAADLLGVHRATVYRRIKRLGPDALP